MPVLRLTDAYLLAKTLDFGMRSRVDTAQEATISLRLFIPGPSRE
jgi:hypothetical protein